jgi:hypothetical protein
MASPLLTSVDIEKLQIKTQGQRAPGRVSAMTPSSSPTKSKPGALTLAQIYVKRVLSKSPESRQVQKVVFWAAALVFSYWAGKAAGAKRQKLLG